MNRRTTGLAGCLAGLLLSPQVTLAGGSGLNVAVVVNQNSADSVQLGNYYCEQRQVPPQNFLRLTNWTGGNVKWTTAEFTHCLLNPLIAALSSRQLAPQIDFVVLSMDIPYQVTEGASVNSTTAALFYGFKSDTAPPDPDLPASCSLPPASSNSYAFSERVFRSAPPDTAPTQPFLTMMITASNLSQAMAIVDHGVASDSTFPTQTVVLAKTSDADRNVRFLLFDDAIFNTRLRGNVSILRTNLDSPLGLTNLLGYQTGLFQFSILPNAFAAGALADSLTSFGGILFEPNDHTTLLAFLNAGAAGSYGTVVEPCNYLEKFPSPHDYFYQARGFSLAEAYYLSVQNPYQGLLIGEPLAAPFSQPPSGAWNHLPPEARLAGTTNLSLQFTARLGGPPVQQVDIFLDGAFLQTINRIAPAESNLLSIVINGLTVNYLVPADATVESVASNLADQLNAASNATSVTAYALGDRIELHSGDLAKTGDQISVTASSASGATSFVTASRAQFLDSIAFAARDFGASNPPLVGDWLQIDVVKTNGTRVSLSATNAATNGTLLRLIQSLASQINNSSALQSPDGVVAEDVLGTEPPGKSIAQLTLRARATGPGPSQIQAILAGSPTFLLLPAATNRLDGNLGDVQPRNHLYLTAGVTNLPVNFQLDTTALADGYHQLAAVAYEGSHVRAQRRLAQDVIIANTPLAATLGCLVCDTNTAVEATLQFSVTANTNAVSRIELYSTGGLLAIVTSQSSAIFSVAGTNLGIGLHPFYAIVTGTSGGQYRTATKWIRLVGADSPFPLQIAGPPPLLSWPAAAGRSYDILGAGQVLDLPQFLTTLTPTNGTAKWTDTNAAAASRFYRVRTSK